MSLRLPGFADASRLSVHRLPASRQRGAALIVALFMLVTVLLLGASATQIALQGEKAARNERDRQIAFQAAEAALIDAELDIEGSPDAARSRSHIFAPHTTEGFSPDCGSGADNVYLGLCDRRDSSVPPAWKTLDLLDATPVMQSVPYGRFTGQSFSFGKGTLPAKPPRYLIEMIPYSQAGAEAGREAESHLYRVTAIGFGMRDTTQVVLQILYRKAA